MRPVEELVPRTEKIMVVDDNPANLKLLQDMLRQKGYEVRCFPRARLALAAAAELLPDLILLDVNMPEMTGYEMCQHLKSMKVVSEIPVLFISALNETEDKVKGFRSGGVDYISKPFQFEEVHARVETHIKLRRSQQAEQELLEQTLNRAIRMLSDLIHLASPELAARSRAIRSVVAWITERMGITEGWQFDLAATLSLLGCIALPEDTFQKGYGGEFLPADQNMMFRTHPETAARLLADIPRLQPIAEMIRSQQTPDLNPGASAEVRLGARMLHLAVEVDRRMYRGLTFSVSLHELRQLNHPFDRAMLDVLREYVPSTLEFHRRELPIRQLLVGMILEEDVTSVSNGFLLFRKGTILTDTWIERLKNFGKSHGVKEPVRVRVPSPLIPGSPPKMLSLSR